MASSAPAHYSVVIIGSGPIGLTLANLLGIYGVTTLVVERNPGTVQEPRAVSIDDESLRTLQAAGVVDEVLGRVVAGYGSYYYTPGRTVFAKVEPTGQPYGYPRRNAFRQPVLEQQLHDALPRFAHVTTLYGWTLRRYAQDDARVSIELAGPDSAALAVTCDWLVGCDGAGSTVREQQGVQLQGTTFDERWLIVDLENNENTTRHTEVFCDTRRPCITLPGPERTRRFEFKLLPGEQDADLLAPAMVERLLRTHGADPGATIRRTVVYRFHARVAPKWSFGRVFLAGDAAHLTPPFAGQGMNSGIRDANNLAWKLAAVLGGRAGRGLLDSYEQERRGHIWQMVHLALRMGRIMSPRNRLHGLAVQSGFRLLKLWPAASDYVAQMKYKPKPRYDAGFLMPEANGRRGGGYRLVGRMLPQPRVSHADGRAGLLDDFLGHGFALLTHGADAAAALAALRHPVWDSLGVTRVALLPADAAAPAGVMALCDPDGSLTAALAPCAGCALLLRPDRYVAARIRLSDPDADALAVERMLAATWNDATPRAAGRTYAAA